MSWHRPTRSRSAPRRFTPRVEALETRDTPAAGVHASLLTAPVTNENGGAAFVRFSLTQRPAANVAFSLTTTDPTEGRPAVSAVTFTPANWNVPQQLKIVGRPDRIRDGNIAYRIVTGPVVSRDAQYRGKSVADIPLTNLDNRQQAAVVVATVANAHTTELGGATVFSVRLAVKPLANVTVPLQSSDLSEGRLSRGAVTFTPLNWNVPQIVTVRGIDDLLRDGDVAYTIRTLPALSLDPLYRGRNGPDVALVNQDNEAPVTLADFDGMYSLTYVGTINAPAPFGGPISGAFQFSITDGVISSGGARIGSLELSPDHTGSASFTGVVPVIVPVVGTFVGTFQPSHALAIAAAGTWSADAVIISASGTWTAGPLN